MRRDTRDSQDAARFRSAFEDAPIGMALVDIVAGRFGRFMHVNPALCELTGHTRAVLESTSFQEISHPEDLEADVDLMSDLVAGGRERFQLETRYQHADGHEVWVLLTASLVRSGDGSPSHVIQQFQDINTRKQFEGQLEYLADHDPLTGLYNRRRFGRELSRQLSYARRYATDGALVVLDLDHLKEINDSLGHTAGDEVLVRTSQLLLERLRDTDLVGRLGGDEFAISLPHTSRAEALALVDALLSRIHDENPPGGGAQRRVSASAGVVFFDADPDVSGADLLITADTAMYEAKAQGGGVSALSPGSDPSPEGQTAQISWSGRIRRALEEGTFVLLAQPIVDLATGALRAHEVLLRLPGADGDLVLPGSFLYTAERFGLIRSLDRWVVSASLDHLRLLRGCDLHVNLSGDSVSDGELPAFVEAELGRTGVDPTRVVFEITETAAIGNMELARAFGARIRAYGCRLALDDFGAGFGSFHYLKYLPLDLLKIDGEFVRHLPESRTDRLLVDAIVRMARGLGYPTVAEHIENGPTLDAVRALGIEFGQGNHVGRPVPIAQLAARRARDAQPPEEPVGAGRTRGL